MNSPNKYPRVAGLANQLVMSNLGTIAILGIAVLASGCATQNGAPRARESAKSVAIPPDVQAVPAAATPLAAEPESPAKFRSAREAPRVVFLDSRTFDLDLSKNMQASPDEIIVDVPGGFNLNQIPERVDKWLFAIKDTGGPVVAEPEVKTRGLIGMIIDVVVSVFTKLDEVATFAPSNQYSATLLYRPDGTVRKMVFKRRASPSIDVLSADEISRERASPVRLTDMDVKSHTNAPDIALVRPGSEERVQSPVDLEVKFTSKDMAQIDMKSLRVYIGNTNVDVTQKLLAHADVGSSRFSARSVNLPEGRNFLTFVVSDLRNRTTKRTFLVEVGNPGKATP